MKAAEFFARELSREELREAIQASPSQYREKLEWILRIWDSEREREDSIRAKANQVIGFHVLTVTTVLAAIPTLLGELAAFAHHGIALAAFSAAGIVALTAAVMGLQCTMSLLRPRLRQVLDPTIVFSEAETTDDWHTWVIVEVLRSYRRNVAMLQELSFQARLLMEWLIVTLIATAIAYAVPAVALRVPLSGYTIPGVAVGTAAGIGIAWSLWHRLVRNPKPHQ